MAGIGGIISVGTRIRRVGLIGIALLSAGCGSSFNWTGSWIGKRDLPLPPGGDPSILTTISKVELTITAGDRFELLEGGVPKSGTVRRDGNRAHLKVERFFNRPIEAQGEAAMKMNQEILLLAQKDGSALFQDPGGLVKDTVRLERKKAESQPGG